MRRWLLIQTQPPFAGSGDVLDADEWIEGEYFTSRGAMRACVDPNAYVTTRRAWEARR